MKRDFNRRSSDYGRFKRSPAEISENNKCKNRTCLANTIDERYPHMTTNINGSLLATSNKLRVSVSKQSIIYSCLVPKIHANASSNKSSTTEHHRFVTSTTTDQTKKMRFIPKFDTPLFDMHSGSLTDLLIKARNLSSLRSQYSIRAYTQNVIF
jgi:hypothetical protein